MLSRIYISAFFIYILRKCILVYRSSTATERCFLVIFFTKLMITANRNSATKYSLCYINSAQNSIQLPCRIQDTFKINVFG